MPLGESMNAHTETRLIEGGHGVIETAIDRPHRPRAGGGVAVIAHPHPLFGGTMHNKVVQTLARAHLQAGWEVVRFNFRGVGQTTGTHDHGAGESDDFCRVVHTFGAGGPLALAGFSFGAYVTARALSIGLAPLEVHSVVLVGTAASRFSVPPLAKELHDRALVIHGEIDDTVALSSVMEWARPQALPVLVVPGVEHFFHGHLPILKSLVGRHLRACEPV